MKKEIKDKISRFLKLKNIAVAGFSTQGNQPANIIFKKFEKNGYNAFAINPKGGELDGVKIHKSLDGLPAEIEGVMACTPPGATLDLLVESGERGIKSFWIHRSFGKGSFHDESLEIARKYGIELIPAGCPMMFIKPDFPHFVMKHIIIWQGKI